MYIISKQSGINIFDIYKSRLKKFLAIYATLWKSFLKFKIGVSDPLVQFSQIALQQIRKFLHIEYNAKSRKFLSCTRFRGISLIYNNKVSDIPCICKALY